MNVAKRVYFVILLFLLMVSCSESKSSLAEKSSYSFELVDTVKLKGALLTGANHIERYQDQYCILDTKNKKLYIFSLKGDLVREFGNPGRGPGEFINPVSLTVDKKGKVYVFDISQQRVTIFNNNGELGKSINIRGSGFEAVVNNDDIFLYNPMVFQVGSPMVPVFNTNSGKMVAELSPAPELAQDIGGGMSGAAISGLAVDNNKLIVLQHPMKLGIRIYELDSKELINEYDLQSNYFNTPEIPADFQHGAGKLSKITNAFISGFFAHDNKLYVLYTEFGTGNKYMDIFTLDGELLTAEAINLEKKFPRYQDSEGYFYSFGWVDSLKVSSENALVELRKYELVESSE